MRPAERPDDAALGQRVFLLGDRAAHLRLHRLGSGPEGGVLPVGISGEHLVRIEKRLIRVSEQILPVLGRAGPVHEPRGFKGRGVEAGKRQVVCDAAGDGRILVRRDGAGQRDDEPQAHLLRRVAVGAVERIGVDERHVQIVQQAGIGVVRVQAHQTAVDYAGAAAPAILEIAADKAADVLDVVALGLGHGGVVVHRLAGAGGVDELVQKLAPEHLPVLPLRRLAAAAYGDEQLLVVGDLHGLASLLGWWMATWVLT